MEVPAVYQGPVAGDLGSRRGVIHATEPRGELTVIRSDVPLANMFGYATELRSMTQGRATFSMHFARYQPAPRDVQEEVIARAREGATRR